MIHSHRDLSASLGFGVSGLFVGAVAVAFAFAACSGNDAAIGGSGNDAGIADASNGQHDSGPTTTDSGHDSGSAVSIGGRNFVARKLYLGDTDRAGVLSGAAWQAYGTNIDGKTSTSASTDVCTLFGGAASTTQIDGNDGIDNSFGKNIIPIMQSALGNTISMLVSQQIEGGAPSFMIDLKGLTDDAAQNLSPIDGQFFAGAHPGGSPTWTATDKWGVYKSNLVSGTLASGSKANFPTATITGGTWASGTTADIPIGIAFGGVTFTIMVHHAVISFDHTAAAHLTNGTISGVIDTEEFVAAFRSIAGGINVALCDGTTFQDFANQFRAASDILKDGTNVAASACDGISMGIGFDATESAPPDSAIDDPIPSNTCGD